MKASFEFESRDVLELIMLFSRTPAPSTAAGLDEEALNNFARVKDANDRLSKRLNQLDVWMREQGLKPPPPTESQTTKPSVEAEKPTKTPTIPPEPRETPTDDFSSDSQSVV